MIYKGNDLSEEVLDDPGFNAPDSQPSIIKVIGVGGGGNNAINHMFKQNIQGVSFVVCNTDRQALNNSPVPKRLLIGPKTCGGLGAGNVPEKAKAAAEESEEDIKALFDDTTKMVFITAGMGGGTGTGAAPVVARIARERGVLTVGIVTIPFIFEGYKKIIKALKGASEMSKYVDAILIINNERLTEIYPNLDFMTAFGKADDTLSTAARSISDIINVNGQINLDFEDVNTTLREGGVAIISSGYGEGEQRVTKAIEDALNSPLLRNRDVSGSKKILINIYFNPKSSKPFIMEEVREMSQFMSNFDNDVDVIWGTAFDESLGDKIKITILASGFNVSLDNEVAEKDKQPPHGDKGNHKKPQPQTEATDTEQANTDMLVREYGAEKVEQREQSVARARFLILSPDDMENDELIDKLENSPTFKRDPKFKSEIKSMQSTASPNISTPGSPAQRSKKTTEIRFDDDM
ncbi:MAG: cell division protein FtsZ [Muribaculaceae bacterium]